MLEDGGGVWMTRSRAEAQPWAHRQRSMMVMAELRRRRAERRPSERKIIYSCVNIDSV